jgi:hypothetical protein
MNTEGFFLKLDVWLLKAAIRLKRYRLPLSARWLLDGLVRGVEARHPWRTWFDLHRAPPVLRVVRK